MKRSLIVLIVSIVVNTLHGQDLSQQQIIALDSIISKNVSGFEPGLAVGLVKDGQVVYHKYAGYSNLENRVPVTDSTLFNMASVAKQFTALLILNLHIEGKLNLEDDLRKYIPGMYSDIKDPIRIRHLLNHSSGIRDFYDLLSVKQKPWWRQVGFDNKDAIDMIKNQKELNFKPGTDSLYSNSNYTLLTEIIEIVTGIDFHTYSEMQFKKLGMENTLFLKNYMRVMPNKSRPYTDWGDGVWKEYPMLTNLYGDGFLFTTLKDQLNFEIAVQKAKETNNRLLIESQGPIPGSEIQSYGFGLELNERLNYRAVHHSGSTGSYHAQTVRYPEQNLSVVVMSNHGNIWSGYIADALSRVFLEDRSSEPMVFDIPDTAYHSNLKESEIQGLYKNNEGFIIRIYQEEDNFYWKADNNNPRKLRLIGGSIFQFEDSRSSRMVVSKQNERISGFDLISNDGDQRHYVRLDPFVENEFNAKEYVGDYYSEELETEFNISLDQEGRLMIAVKEGFSPAELKVVYPDYLLHYDNRIQAERDIFGQLRDLLVSVNRVKRVRFRKKQSHHFNTEVQLDQGYVQVTTIGSSSGDTSDILLTGNDEKGNEIWSERLGGKSYDKASSLIRTKDGGFLITGSTSSFGNGNYDIYLVKTDWRGNVEWQQSFGDFYNDYGLVSEVIDGGFLVKGTRQHCSSNTDINRKCDIRAWILQIDNRGKLISEEFQDLPEDFNP